MTKSEVVTRRTFLLVVGCFMVCLMTSCPNMKEFRQKIDAIQIENIDLQRVRDGEYIGEYDVLVLNVKVLVKVRDYRITEIKLLRHKNGRGKPAEVITEYVTEKQSLQVDAISGATYSSKVILEAIELALKKGLE